MTITPALYASLWTDDYLDLLNYAKQLGDLSWQEEIMLKLTNTTEDAIQTLFLNNERSVLLWKEFDAINDKLLEIFERIEQAEDSTDKLRLTEKMWDLKIQKVNLHHKIRSINN